VATANGAIISNTASDKDSEIIIVTRVLWLPVVACIPLILVSFWLGQRYELASLRKHLEQRETE
jgi:hypothetical protein